jgi:hypothetical protein
VLAALAAARLGAGARQALAPGRTAGGCEWAQEQSAAAAQSRARRKHARVGAAQRWALEQARVPERVAGGGARQGQHPCRLTQGPTTPGDARSDARNKARRRPQWHWRLLSRDGNPIFRPAPTRAGTGRGGRQSGAPPEMEHARRRPTDWKGGGKRRTRDAEDGWWPGREDASSLAREMHEGQRAGRRSGEANAATGCDELEGATVQPGTVSSLCPCGGRGRSNAARVRRAAHDRRRW